VKCLKGETLSVVLDTVLTPELKAEGLLREIVRTVNQMRKDAGLTINDRIKLYVEVEEASLAFKVFTDFETELKKSTLSSELSVNQKDGEVVYQDFTLNNEAIRLGIELIK
jgi:isoleucyl-tRNA synthetase